MAEPPVTQQNYMMQPYGNPGQPGQAIYPAPYQPPPGAYGAPQVAYAGPGMYQQGMPVVQGMPPGQHGKPQVMWMAPPPSIPGCPPGLEYLTQIDQILVHQQIELFEVLTGYETNNKYAIKNSLGQQIYFAVEDTDCCTRNYCGPARPFDIKILDNSGREVLHVTRPYRPPCWCCCPCCLHELSVFGPPGQLIGKVRQNYTCCEPFYSILDASGESLLHVRGPCVSCSCCSDVDFKVLSRDEKSEVGCIRKQWSGLAQEAFTDADNFGVTFPLDMSVTAKATMLGAVFLIDFMFFEHTDDHNH